MENLVREVKEHLQVALQERFDTKGPFQVELMQSPEQRGTWAIRVSIFHKVSSWCFSITNWDGYRYIDGHKDLIDTSKMVWPPWDPAKVKTYKFFL